MRACVCACMCADPLKGTAQSWWRQRAGPWTACGGSEELVVSLAGLAGLSTLDTIP